MGKKLKIVIFDGSFNTTPFINRLIEGLTLNHHVYVLGFNEKLENRIKHVKYISLGSNTNKLSFLYRSLLLAIKSNSLLSFIKLLINKEKKRIQQKNLDQILSEINPDIIHLQWPSLLSWVEDILITQKYPCILSLRGTQINVEPFINHNKLEYLNKWLPYLPAIHSVSNAIVNKSRLLNSNQSCLYKTIYTGLDLDNFKFSDNDFSNKPIKILSIGRNHWIKGYKYAIEAMKNLKEQGLYFQYEIIGADRSEELLYLINDYGLSSEIILTPRISQSEVFNKMSQASFTLVTSIEEGIANVAVESMAMGIPVLSTDCGGMSELILNNKNGWLVEKRNSLSISNKILEITELNKESLLKIKKEARLTVEKKFTKDIMIKEMDRFYHQIIEINNAI